MHILQTSYLAKQKVDKTSIILTKRFKSVNESLKKC